MKLLIKNKIEIIQNTRFVFFFQTLFLWFFNNCDWLTAFCFRFFLARAFVESNMCLLQKPQNNAVAHLHSQHMNWWWLSLWTPSNWSRDLNSAPLRNQSTILNVDDGLQPFSHETLWQLCWFHQDSQSEKLEEGFIPETWQAPFDFSQFFAWCHQHFFVHHSQLLFWIHSVTTHLGLNEGTFCLTQKDEFFHTCFLFWLTRLIAACLNLWWLSITTIVRRWWSCSCETSHMESQKSHHYDFQQILTTSFHEVGCTPCHILWPIIFGWHLT